MKQFVFSLGFAVCFALAGGSASAQMFPPPTEDGGYYRYGRPYHHYHHATYNRYPGAAKYHEYTYDPYPNYRGYTFTHPPKFGPGFGTYVPSYSFHYR